ncbi:hypothetical protein C7974DRAFT_429590 [Boeremia exigua]|uniref:uncharacterized protein n=1 Tax=Boeremia exigua TaxID=749465 RepID=UPI001E8D87EB|nr:uncharacterized protein C7974DRAFT_429590 [Boeremia exigua]KAH6611644.1 hypothetical protein C7974DRAFT_429590 [Boeremia exigua]
MKDTRELFTWTAEQKLYAIRLWDALDGRRQRRSDGALLASISLFIFTTYHLWRCLLGRLRTAKNYSYSCWRWVYCVRVLALEKLLPGGQRDTQTEEDRDSFLATRHKQLADGTFSPMSEMISMLAYGKHIGLTAGNSGNAYWSEDKQTFYLNGRLIVIRRFCKMAQDLLAETEQMYEERQMDKYLSQRDQAIHSSEELSGDGAGTESEYNDSNDDNNADSDGNDSVVLER